MSSSLSALAFFLAGPDLAFGFRVVCVNFFAGALALAAFLGAALALGFCRTLAGCQDLLFRHIAALTGAGSGTKSEFSPSEMSNTESSIKESSMVGNGLR